MRLWLTFAACLLACCGTAATWYAASNGSSTNGTSALPWSPQYAVTNGNPYLQPGDTVLFKAGTYWCPEWAGASYSMGISSNTITFRASGTAANKLTYQSETPWGFEWSGTVILPATTSNVVFKQFHISQVYTTNRIRTADGGGKSGILGAGIDEYGRGNEILHNLIENCGHPGIGSWGTTYGKTIRGNIIRFTGDNDFTSEGASGDPRGSGMYMQNDDGNPQAIVAGNISYYNYTTGMKAYGTRSSSGFTFSNNITMNNVEAGIFAASAGNPMSNIVIAANSLWENYSGSAIKIGYGGDGGNSNAVVYGNTFVAGSGALGLHGGWSNCTFTNNLAVTTQSKFVWFMEYFQPSGFPGMNITSHDIDYNTYYSTNNLDVWDPFEVVTSNVTFSVWKTAIGNKDSNSTWQYGNPANTSYSIFRPSSDTNWLHVAVFNWTNASSLTVNVGTYFSPGSSLAIYDAQNLPTAFTNLTLTGSSVSLPLTLTNTAPMQGLFTNRTDVWSGFDTNFRSFVIYQQPATMLSANTLNIGTLIIGQ